MRQLDPDERNITILFEEVRAIKNEMEDIIVMIFDLKNFAKNPGSPQSSKVLEGLMQQMNPNLASILKKTKTIKTRIDLVNKSNENNRTLSDAYKEGSTVDLTRVAMTLSIKLSLNEMMEEFKSLREMVFDEKVKRSSDQEMVVGIRGRVFEGGGGSEMERYFNEIYQAFLEMAVMFQDRAMDIVEETDQKKKKGRTWIGCKCFC